jgi:hypothetical protein
MPGRRSRVGSRVALGCSVLAAALLLAACGSSGFHYVKSSDDRTFFKVPDEWTLFDNDHILDASKADLSDEEIEQARETRWVTVFDGHPKATLNHIANKAPGFPVGRAVVQDLSPELADEVSLMALRNLFFDIDAKIEKKTGQVIAYEPVERDGGFHGSHLVVKLATSRGDIVVNQIAMLDQGTTKVYALAVSCSVECYDRDQSRIEQVIDSWTVEES